MFSENLIQLRKFKSLTQEEVAEKVGVSRQAVAKWESGDSVPDIDKCSLLAQLFEVSLDDLVNFDPKENMDAFIPPKGKHIFGVVTVGDKGQIVIPAKARKIFNISVGENLVVLGDETTQGLAILKTESFLSMAEIIRNAES
ncbi:MAG: helix-turn-helix domain-containing protein [Treponema sp.]|jgi:AbrB family looped-hinge helix DNA binding protein|nr:helix-turn-helix domain-containing protein [Treponema sp.]MBQ2529904.1 helix-turn-helix domain-containing protein [Treponema sp.]MBQ3981656.1 helix-turn-helix domain-containing protein [Treponema sp.]